MLVITNLRYGQLLQGVDLQLSQSEMVALVGSNGSGKSTLLKILCGLIPRDEGEIVLEDSASMGLVFQNPESQFVANTVEEEVAFGPGQLGIDRAQLQERVDWALAQVGLENRKNWQSHALSAGQKQRLAIASVLALRPRYLLLDEPTSMLDPNARRELLQLLQGLKQQVGILLITHRSEEVLACDRILHLKDGKIQTEVTPSQLQDQPELWPNLDLVAPAGLRLQAQLHEPPPETPFVPKAQNPALPHFAVVDRLSYTYARGTPMSHQALSNLSCHIPQGVTTAIVGHTGSGKSTLLQHLNLLLRPQVNGLRIFDQPVTPKMLAKPVRRRVGILFQQPELQFFQETCWDEVGYAPKNFGLEVDSSVRQAMQQVDLPAEQFAQRSPFELSGGEQRRLGLASILSYQPQVLVLDEPTAGLDATHRALMWKLLQSLQEQGTTLVLISHDMEEVGNLAHHIICLDSGGVQHQGRPEQVFPLLAGAGFQLPVWSQWSLQHFPQSPVPASEEAFKEWLGRREQG